MCDKEVPAVTNEVNAESEEQVNSTSSQPPGNSVSGVVHSDASCDNGESGSNGEQVNFEDNALNNQPSSSSQPVLDDQPVEEGRHRYADYFLPTFTNEMIEFMIDPRNRGGKEWIPPKVKPTKEELDALVKKAEEMARAVENITPSDSENEEDYESSSSSDEGIAEMV